MTGLTVVSVDGVAPDGDPTMCMVRYTLKDGTVKTKRVNIRGDITGVKTNAEADVTEEAALLVRAQAMVDAQTSGEKA